MMMIHPQIIFLLSCVLCLTFATTLYLSPYFFFPFPDACLHMIESEPGAGSRPGVQQPNKLSAQNQARPAGKKLCVRTCEHTVA